MVALPTDSAQQTPHLYRVREAIDLGIRTVPVPFKHKGPTIHDWQNTDFSYALWEAHYSSIPWNIGGKLGPVNNGTTDIDLDDERALCIAADFLPRTDAVYGHRPSNPDSHWLYRTGLPAAIKNYDDPISGQRILELRTDGQSVLPGSVHRDTGELIEWSNGRPNELPQVDGAVLKRACDLLVMTTVFGKYWPTAHTGRDKLELAIAGGMIRAKFTEDEVVAVIDGAWTVAGERLDGSTRGMVQRTITKVDAGDAVSGWPTVAKLFGTYGRKIVDWICETFDIGRGPLLAPLRTDLGNAERFAYANNGAAVYVAERDEWSIWDGRRWERMKGRKIDLLAKETARAFQIAAVKMPANDPDRDDMVDWAMQLDSDKRLKAMIAWSRSLMEVNLDVFDTDPWLLNCANGTVDLRTGELRAHNPEDRISKITDIVYDPAAQCPTWDAFLARAQRTNDEMLRFLQQLVGIFISGCVTEKILPIIYGPKDAGKSVFTDIVYRLAGEYGQMMKEETLAYQAAKGSGSGATPDIARLVGIRLALVSETSADMRLNEARVKAWTGRNRLSGRELHKPQFDFDPTHKLLIETNNRPIIVGGDQATWGRVKLIPFNEVIPKEEQDKSLPAKLEAELSGILTWAVRGCLDWQANGLIVPNEVQAATDEYEEDMDQLRDFIEERCVVGPTEMVTNAELLTMYNRWAKDNEVRFPLGRNKFNEAIRQRGITPHRDSTKPGNPRSWLGIGLKTSQAVPKEQRDGLDQMTAW